MRAGSRAGSELGLGRSPGLGLCLCLVCWLGRSAELGEHLARLGFGLVRDRDRDKIRDKVRVRDRDGDRVAGYG